MKYTFEITIAGCSTNCDHCYVDGGPASEMPIQVYERCVHKLQHIFANIDGDISLTLGNEIYCHKDILRILEHASQTVPQYFSFENQPAPTTGIALLKREDRDDIIRQLRKVNANGFMLAIHGSEERHDRTVHRRGAYTKLFEAADYFAANGLFVLFNLIVSKNLCTDIEEVVRRTESYSNSDAIFNIPLYVPSRRMRAYQAVRAEHSDCVKLAKQAERYGMDTANLKKLCEYANERAVISDLKTNGFCYEEEKERAVHWKFFNVTQNGDLFYGNVGAHTKYIGNLLTCSDEVLVKAIESAEPNYDYVAYYPDEAFIWLERNVLQVPSGSHNYVYKSKAECLYAILDELGIKNALI